MKYTKALFLAVSLAFVAPLVADAAWWNPLSWFKDEPVQAPSENASFRAQQVAPLNGQVNSQLNSQADKTVSPATLRTVAPAAMTAPAAKPALAPKVLPTAPVQVIESQIEVPIYAIDSAFAPATYNYPRDIRNGTVIMAIKPSSDSKNSDWQLDRMVYHVVSDRLRSGDMTVSVGTDGVAVKDFTTVNEKTAVSLAGRSANATITFTINGSLPSKGDFKVVIDELTGFRSADNGKKAYVFIGSPIEGPRFDL